MVYSEDDNDILTLLIQYYKDQRYYDDINDITSQLNILAFKSSSIESFGYDFGEMIKKNINEADKILIIITKNCECSIWVNQEIGYIVSSRSIDDYRCIVEEDLVGKGWGFIHSNIDVQSYVKKEAKFDKIEQYFIDLYGKKAPPRDDIVLIEKDKEFKVAYVV